MYFESIYLDRQFNYSEMHEFLVNISIKAILRHSTVPKGRRFNHARLSFNRLNSIYLEASSISFCRDFLSDQSFE